MPDYADIAAQHDFTEESLVRHRARNTNPVPRGVCLYCGSKINSDQIYCDAYCKEDYEREQKIKGRTRI